MNLKAPIAPSAGLAAFPSVVHQLCVMGLQGASMPTTENIRNWLNPVAAPVATIRLAAHPNLVALESIARTEEL